MMALRLADIRVSKGFTQVQLAEKSGISQETISLYETGKQRPLPESLIKLAKALDCSVGELLGIEKGGAE